MSPGEFAEYLFKLGTGWLGWSPDLVLDTPIPQLMLALEGKIDFAKKTNPFAATEKDDSAVRKIEEQRALFHRMKMDARSKAAFGAENE